jgi:hypothetical protein
MATTDSWCTMRDFTIHQETARQQQRAEDLAALFRMLQQLRQRQQEAATPKACCSCLHAWLCVHALNYGMPSIAW